MRKIIISIIVIAMVAVAAMAYRKPNRDSLFLFNATNYIAHLESVDSLDMLIDDILGTPVNATERTIDSIVRSAIDLLHQPGNRWKGMQALRKAVNKADKYYGTDSERYLDLYLFYEGKKFVHLFYNTPDHDLYSTDMWLRKQLKAHRNDSLSEKESEARAYLERMRSKPMWHFDNTQIFDSLPAMVERNLGMGNCHIIDFLEEAIRIAPLANPPAENYIIDKIYGLLIPHYEAACGRLSWQRLDTERRRILHFLEPTYSKRHIGFSEQNLMRARRFLSDWESAGLTKTFGYWQAVHIIAFIEYTYAHNHVRAASLDMAAIRACDHLTPRLFMSTNTNMKDHMLVRALIQGNRPDDAKEWITRQGYTEIPAEVEMEFAMQSGDWDKCMTVARTLLDDWENKVNQQKKSKYAQSVKLLYPATMYVEALIMKLMHKQHVDSAARNTYFELFSRAEKDVMANKVYKEWILGQFMKKVYASDTTSMTRKDYMELIAELDSNTEYLFSCFYSSDSMFFDYLQYVAKYRSALCVLAYLIGNKENFHALADDAMTYLYMLEDLKRYSTHSHFDEASKKRLYQRYLISLIAVNDKNKYVLESRRIFNIIVDELRRGFSSASKNDRSNYFTNNRKLLLNTLSSTSMHAPDIEEANRVTYDNALLIKGLQLKAERSLSKFLRDNNDSTGIRMLNQLNRHKEYGDATRIQIDSLEQAIANRATIYGDYTDGLFTDWRQVRDALKPREGAVEFFMQESTGVYMALILKPGDEAPHTIRLPIEAELSKYDFETIYTTDSLSQMIWAPLQPYLKGLSTVYFSPIGILNNIAIEYMPLPQGMTENLYRMSSTAELCRQKNKYKFTDIAVFGGAEFDSETDHLANSGTRSALIPKNALADSLGLRAGFEYLPGTMAEASAIKNCMGHRHIRLYTGNRASEQSFKALSGSGVDLIHVATHGFYWNEREARRQRNATFLQNDADAEDRSLSRSGFLLSGANKALQGHKTLGSDDGIVTAREISALDLASVRLAVLSACQTGVGDVSSEGVFGLQRGLKKAGVKSIMMSLWNVDDQATQILMTQFYSNLKSNADPRKALENARRHLRQQPGYESPRYWASFVILD